MRVALDRVRAGDRDLNGETIWEGEVQVFDVDHPKAKRAYAWSDETDEGKRRFVVVLQLRPVTDAITAVRAAIASRGNV